MCGIVLAGGNLFSSDVGLFEKLLFCDTFRGDHSTGVIAGYHSAGKVFSYTAKAAVAAPEFLKSPVWADVSKKKVGTAVVASTPKFLIGHNRYATRGAKTAENAHPFTHGHISLVHNGTLVDQTLLPEHSRFVVDSENIAYSISVNGAEETIKNLNGAFTLVWYDSKLGTVNIIRNNERPFHLVEATCGDWFGASEEEMLLWILGRDDKYSITKTSPSIKRHFECEVGVQYVFDVSLGSFKLVDEIKHDLPKFPPKTYSYGVYGGGYAMGGYERANTTPYTRPVYTTELSDKILERFCVNHKIGDYINFNSYDFKVYSHSKERGSLNGYLPDSPSFVDVIHHGLDVDKYEQFAEYRGKIVSAFEPSEKGVPSGFLNIIVTDVSLIKSSEEVLKEEGTFPPDSCCDLTKSSSTEKVDMKTGEVIQLPAVIEDKGGEVASPFVSTDDGAWYSKSSWESSKVSTCLHCKTQIPFAEMDLAVSHGEGYHCWRCSDEIATELEEVGFASSKSSHHTPRYTENWTMFTCTGCGQHRSYVDESDSVTDLCVDCYESYYCGGGYKDRSYEKKEDTKFAGGVDLVTESQWETIGMCAKCSNSIPWEDCEHVTYSNGEAICLNCVDL